jgi:signal transduction histidine kinase
MYKHKSILGILISKILGIAIFLALLWLANLLTSHIHSLIYQQIIEFFNSNVLFLISIAIIFLIADLFAILIFPLNLPAPVFTAVGLILTTSFILSIFALIDSLLGKSIFEPLLAFSVLLYIIIFIFAIIAGYATIFSRLAKKSEEKEEKEEKPEEKTEPVKEQEEKKPVREKKKVEWKDVGENFKQALYKTGRKLNDALDRKEKKKRRRK